MMVRKAGERGKRGKKTVVAAKPPENVETQASEDNQGAAELTLLDLPQAHPMQEEQAAETEGHSKQKRSKRAPLKLDQSIEEIIFLWVRDHPDLYDKNHPNFLKTDVKDALWAAKANEMKLKETDGTEVQGPRLKAWLTNMRNAYGKASRLPSGSGARPKTNKEKWIMTQLGYMDEHIYRVPKRAGVNLMEVIREKHPGRFPDEPASVPDPEPEDRCSKGDTPPTAPSSPTSDNKRKRDKEPNISTVAVLQKLSNRIEDSSAQQARYFQSIKDKDPLTAQRQAFGEWIARSAHDMDDEDWSDFQLEVHQSLSKYRRQTMDRRAQQQRRPQASAALMTPSPVSQAQPVSSVQQDFQTAMSVAEMQQRQCPSGWTPEWTHKFQQPQQQQPPRPASAPMASGELNIQDCFNPLCQDTVF